MKQTITLTESQLNKIITQAVRQLTESEIDEKVKSQKLTNAIKRHGGLDNGRWSKSFGNDLYNMTDDDFDDYEVVDLDKHYQKYGSEAPSNPNQYNNQNFKPIKFNDGTFMVKRNPSHDIDDREAALRSKRSERGNAKTHDGANEYQYENPYMNQLVNQGSRTYDKPRGQWGIPGENSQNKGLGRINGLNPMALKQKHIYDTYGNDADSKVDDLWKGKYSENDLDKNIVGKAWNSRNQNVSDAVSEVVRRVLAKLVG